MSSSFNIDTLKQIHKLLAPALFNKTWELLEKEDRTVDEDHLMLAAAFASWYHWKQIGGAIEDERGLWLISKVLVTLNKHSEALGYAQKCLSICLENNISGFDLAFAYEILSRILLNLNHIEEAREYYQKAIDTGKNIKDNNDREYFFSQLNSLPIDVDNLALNSK